MLQAIKVRLYPNTEQAHFLNAQFGAVRFVYNKALAIIGQRYKKHLESLNAVKNIKPLLKIAKESRKYGWLKSYDSIALQEACRNLNKSYQNFFKRLSRYPRFKSKRFKQSSYHCTGLSRGDDWIKIPKLKSVIKAKIHRNLDGVLKSITLSRTCTGKYYASMLIEMVDNPPALLNHINSDSVIGIDVGISHLLNDSNGKKQDNPRFLQRAYRNLRRKQKSLSRKQKGSKGRARARNILAKCHEKVVNAREDFQHKVSKAIVDENQAIVVESLQIKNMLKNHKLAKHIADCAWSNLLNKLSYKAERQGKHFVKLGQWFASSKLCSCCGYKVEKLPLSVRHWICPECKMEHDRDINAALNIKKRGIVQLKAEGLSVSANGGLRKPGCYPAVA